ICYTSPTGLLSTSTTGCTGSSLRFKDNIADLTYGLTDLMKIRAVSFDYKPEMFIPGHQIGFIAEELINVVPEVVGSDSNGLPSNVDYGRLVSLLVKAIQDLYTEFTQLKETIAAMAERMVSREIVATERLCVGNTCISEQQLLGLLQNSGQSYTVTSSTNDPASAEATAGEASTSSTQTSPNQDTSASGTGQANTENATTTTETTTSIDTATTTSDTTTTSTPVAEPVIEPTPEPAPTSEPAPEPTPEPASETVPVATANEPAATP
ncbi:MAG: tail fiber domain-containing protein, partial [Patescibacteria group bacterium]